MSWCGSAATLKIELVPDSRHTSPSMTRIEIEKTVDPILHDCLREFGDHSPENISAEAFAVDLAGELRPDIRRVSLLISLAQKFLSGEPPEEGLELGCGYGYLLFPLAKLVPKIHWTGVEHPSRPHFQKAAFLQAVREANCELVGADFVHEPLPFRDAHFSVITFSETLEHLPVERLGFILGEMERVLRPGGILIVSSPNQASLENRIRLFKGVSILDIPNRSAYAKGTFGHIRVYTHAEMQSIMTQYGFSMETIVLESNNSAYRGPRPQSLRRRLYRLYERVEAHVNFLRPMADTWYMVFRKNAAG
jgi:SAM-dependent methyltransferase